MADTEPERLAHETSGAQVLNSRRLVEIWMPETMATLRRPRLVAQIAWSQCFSSRLNRFPFARVML
jgi:hypothetical protein